MNTPHEVTGPINLGNPDELTLLELATKVVDLVGGTGRIDHRSLPEDDPLRRRPDITLGEVVLGWKPTVDLNQGLARTVEHFRSVLELPSL